MIIGISNGNKSVNKNVASYIEQNYDYKMINVDEIFHNIINENFDFSMKNIYEIKQQINNSIFNILSEGENYVINFTLLEDLEIFDYCDAKIKICNNLEKTKNSGLFQKIRGDFIDNKYNQSIYTMKLNINSNWQRQVDYYMNNVFNASTKVTIVVPIYNTAEYLPRLLNAIIEQTYKNIEVLLIDDGSIDNSLEVCNYFANKDPRVKVIHQKNMGLSETRNKGIKLASGDYISFLDSDDYIEPTMMEELVKKAKETNADICQCGFWIHMKNGFVKDVTNEQNDLDYYEGKSSVINAHANHFISIAAWDKLYKLSAIENMYFDKTVTKEDADYIFRLCMKEKTFAIVNKPLYHYIKRPATSITGGKISSELFNLQKWGHNAYEEVLSNGKEYQDAAEKILFNSLTHIMRYYMRDYKRGILNEGEFQDEIQNVVNDLMNLLLHAKNVEKFRKLDEILEIVNEFIRGNVIKKDELPTMNVPCIGILWNSLDNEMKEDAIKYIEEKAKVNKKICVDLGEVYSDFINEVYSDADEFLGIRVIKAGTLIDRYDTNDIVILNLIIKVSQYVNNKKDGFVYEEIEELKTHIRDLFRKRIKNYAFDNVFHLTTDTTDYNRTNEACKKYVRDYMDLKYENK